MKNTENLFLLWLPAGVVQEQLWSPAFRMATCLKPHVPSCCVLRRAEHQREAYPRTPAEQCLVVGILSCCSREGFQNTSLNPEIWDPNSTLPWICVQLPCCPWKQNPASWTQLFQRAGTDSCLWDNICFNQLVWYTQKSNKTSGVVQLWSQALIPYYVANQATVIRSRSHCTVPCAVSSCAGVRAWSTVSLYHCRVVNVKLAVQCCYNSHMSVVNVNGVCNMVKMDTFSFQMWCKLCTVKEFFLYFLSTECLPELLLN